MLDHVPAVKEARDHDRLMLGTIDSWLMYKFSARTVHVTDETNASRTFLMDLHRRQWSENLCQKLNIPLSSLPAIHPNSHHFCSINTNEHHILDKLGHHTPILGSIGDQQAALFGNMCFSKGEVKCTYGTGCFILVNVGEHVVFSTHNLIATVGYRLRDGPTMYALEGSIGGAGACIEWMQRNLSFYHHPHEMETISRTVPNSDGVVFVPAFGGLLAPYWDPHARGTILGMTYKTTKAHILRAALYSIAKQVSDILSCMHGDAHVPLVYLKVDGGLSHNRVLMEMQSDELGVKVHVPHMAETTALGAALCAGLYCGVWKSLEDIKAIAEKQLKFDVIKPTEISPAVRQKRNEEWKRAVEKANWAKL
ncbi:glycerol kinase [Strigomonas culicis]|nr:glycerol kinase [Strigomonas culicis]|eukprot:EPY24842.1 glycerol kinase [Strigomonas culicis]